MSTTFAIHNPADFHEIVGNAQATDINDIDPIVRKAHSAQRNWAATAPSDRAKQLAEAVAGLELEGMAELTTQEVGKPLADSQREYMYLLAAVSNLEPEMPWLAHGQNLGSSATHVTKVLRAPFGVVGVIGAWNAPVGMSMVNVAPALVAGNSVILHLPPSAPLAAGAVFTRLQSALPDGVLSLVTSPDPSIAQALVEHPLVRHIHFTGSCAVGRLVAAEAAASLTALTLELGGNDPAILLEDAFDIPDLFASVAAAALMASGQACIALKRLYVPRSRVDDAIDGLREVFDAHVVGNGLHQGVTLGPLHTDRQRDYVRSLVVDAGDRGARVVECGTYEGDPSLGYFLKPTLVAGLDNDAPLVQQEQFGPALPIIAYDDLDQALAMANDSEYGLAASVWSRDVDEAEQVAQKIESGMVAINAHGAAAVDTRAPFGGLKSSGIGRGGSNRAGLETFTEPRAIIRRGA